MKGKTRHKICTLRITGHGKNMISTAMLMVCLLFSVVWRWAFEGMPTRAFFCSYKIIAIALYRKVVTTNGVLINEENGNQTHSTFCGTQFKWSCRIFYESRRSSNFRLRLIYEIAEGKRLSASVAFRTNFIFSGVCLCPSLFWCNLYRPHVFVFEE